MRYICNKENKLFNFFFNLKLINLFFFFNQISPNLSINQYIS
jgi:hypothetical protein